LITRIEAKNFGPFGNTIHALPVGPETLIVGPNNAGKSTFIAAYALVASNGFNPSITKYRNLEEAAFGHNLKSEVMISIHAEVEGETAERAMYIGQGPLPSGYSWSGAVPIPSGGIYQASKATNQDAANSLQQSLNDTWYLMSNREFVPTAQQITNPAKVLNPQGTNAVQFLLERWTSRDPQWPEAEKWLKKIDSDMLLLKSPLRGQLASIETSRKIGELEFDVNLSLQGGGIQRALQIVSAVVFSPKGSVIIIEEPEMNLHKESQEVLVDLFNKAVNEWDKQIIVTTHSWDVILPFISDLGSGSKRGGDHIKAEASKFKMAKLSRKNNDIDIEDYDISKEFKQIKDDFKIMWG